MSIQNQIDRITNNIADAYAAIDEKGGSAPEEANCDNLAEAIRSIPGNTKTLYQQFQENGYTGTEEEFQELLASGLRLTINGGTVTGPFTVENITDKNGATLTSEIVFKEAELFPYKFDTRASLSFPDSLFPKYTSINGAPATATGWVKIDSSSSLLLAKTLSMNKQRIVCLGNPTYDSDAANKGYVDDQIAAISARLDQIETKLNIPE